MNLPSADGIIRKPWAIYVTDYGVEIMLAPYLVQNDFRYIVTACIALAFLVIAARRRLS